MISKMHLEPCLSHLGTQRLGNARHRYAPFDRARAAPGEGAGVGGRKGRRPVLLNAYFHSAERERLSFLVPYQRQDAGRHCLQHMHRGSGHKEDG